MSSDTHITYLYLAGELGGGIISDNKNCDEETHNKLSKIKDYTNLLMLSLDFNKLKSIPSSLMTLGFLEQLSLANNLLTELPENIGSLVSLKELYLQNNLLTKLPESICKLANLEKLNISCNKLVFLPKYLTKLKNLNEVSVNNNLLTNIPKNILDNNIWKFDESSYQLNNLSVDCENLIIWNLNVELTNLPISLKELRLYNPNLVSNIKLPFDCVLNTLYTSKKI